MLRGGVSKEQGWIIIRASSTDGSSLFNDHGGINKTGKNRTGRGELKELWMGELEGAVTWVNLRGRGIAMMAGGPLPQAAPRANRVAYRFGER